MTQPNNNEKCEHIVDVQTQDQKRVCLKCGELLPSPVSSAEEIREEWDKIFQPPVMRQGGCCPMCGIKTDEIADWWLSHRKAEYTSLIEEVGKMRLYAETEISSTTLGNIQNTLLRQHVESHNQALDEVIKLIQEKL